MTVHLEASSAIQLIDVLGGDGEHAAGADPWVVQRGHGSVRTKPVDIFLGVEQEVNHETNDLTRGEVFTGGLIR